MRLIFDACELGPLPTNCYLCLDEESGKAFVVDPGFYLPPLESMLVRHGVKTLDYILLTHGHYDHILGVAKLKERFGGKVVISKTDEPMLKDDTLSLMHPSLARIFRSREADITVADGDTLPFADGSIYVIATPGHTAGSVCYLLDDLMFTGDTLFQGTVGRTDFPTGSLNQMLQSCRILAAIPDDYRVLPGHEAQTTLAREQRINPYLTKMRKP